MDSAEQEDTEKPRKTLKSRYRGFLDTPQIKMVAKPIEDDDFSWIPFDPRFVEEFNDLYEVD